MTDKLAPVPGTAAKPRRMVTRDATFLQADLKRADGSTLEGLRVRNLSSGGLMLETSQPIDQGEVVAVVLRNVGAVPGRVAWAEAERVGIAFERPIKPGDVRRAPARSPGATMQLLRPENPQSRRPGLKNG